MHLVLVMSYISMSWRHLLSVNTHWLLNLFTDSFTSPYLSGKEQCTSSLIQLFQNLNQSGETARSMWTFEDLCFVTRSQIEGLSKGVEQNI